jgi:hypothetical protein
MKYILTILMLCGIAQAQTIPGYNFRNSRERTIAQIMTDGLHAPAVSGFPVIKTGVWIGDGEIKIDTLNNRYYFRSSGSWWKLIDSTTFAAGTEGNWKITGNAGLNRWTHFVGTTDATELRFRVNSNIVGRITPVGPAYLDTTFASGIYFGHNAGKKDTGTIRNTIAIGPYALENYASTEPGSGQIAIGLQALNQLVGGVTTGSNVGIGTRAGARLTTGYRNVFLGLNTGHNGTTGHHNTFVGTFAGEWNSTGTFNDAFAHGSLRNNNFGTVNTAIGTQALFYNTGSVISVTMTGSSSDWTTATPVFSAPDVAPFGFSSAVQPTGTAIIDGGQIVGVTITEPGVAVPANATISFTGDGTSATATVNVGAGGFNVGLGADALFYNRIGYGNTALGYRSGYLSTRWRDSSNTFVGRSATVSGSAGSDPLKFMTVIGAEAIGNQSNSVILGRTTDKTGIGNIAPQDRLHVTGRVRFDSALVWLGTTTAGSGYVGPFGSSFLAMPNLDANGFLPAFYMRNASAGSNAAIAMQMNNNLNSYMLLELEGSNRTTYNPDGVLLVTNGAGGIKFMPGGTAPVKIGFGSGTTNDTRIYKDSLFTALRAATTAADSQYVVTFNSTTKEHTYSYFPAGGGGSGVTTMAAIGSSPNADGATISGSTLNLEPASGSFGGVVTTGTQTFAGAKTFSSFPTFSAGTTRRIPFFTTGGLITDDANLGYNASGELLVGTTDQGTFTGQFGGPVIINITGVATGLKFQSNDNYAEMSFAQSGVPKFAMGQGGSSTAAPYNNNLYFQFQSTTASHIWMNNAGVHIFGLSNTGKVNYYGASAITDGQVLLGHTANGTFEKGTITAGTGISVTNSAGSVTIAATGTPTSSFRTPTATNDANVDASTPGEEHYYRIGDLIHVWGTIEIDATAANTTTTFFLDFPVASAISAQTQVTGGQVTAQTTTGTIGVGYVIASVANDNALFNLTPSGTGAITYSYSYSYRVILP